MPKRSLPGDRLLRSGGHKEHLKRVAQCGSTPSYKERALARTRSAPSAGLSRLQDV